MATKLRKLKISRVAVCPQGANPDADILLFKSAPVTKEEVTVGDVYTVGGTSASACTDATCTDPNCPTHGPGRKKKRVAKGPVSEMGTHAEPDGDEQPPLDYRTRGQQYDLWEELWGKWECFCTTFYACIGDSDSDNVPYLPILVDSIGQFQEDVAQLLEDCGVVAKVGPALEELHMIGHLALVDVGKAGAAMAGHRRKRLQDAIAALQQLLEECTPEALPHGVGPAVDRAGVSAAEVVPATGYGASHTPYLMKGRAAMALKKNAESDKEHCDTCDSEDCDNPAHDRMKKELLVPGIEVTKVQAELDTLRAELETTKTALAKAEQDLAARDVTIAKMKQTPEEQEAEYWAGVPESVRKKHEADEAEKVELRKQLDDARAEREQTVYITKTADFRGFGMVQKHWPILKAIDAMDAEVRDELLRLIKASQEQARTAGLFTVVGLENTTIDTRSASDQLMTMTKAYMDEKGVDFMKASEAIAKAHPELYQRSIQERRRAARVAAD